MRRHVVAGVFERPAEGLTWAPKRLPISLPLVGGRGWVGAAKQRSCLEINIPALGELSRIYLAGLFALYEGEVTEPLETVGASLIIRGARADQQAAEHSLNLVSGRHYLDSSQCAVGTKGVGGDGTSLEIISSVEYNGRPHGVGLLTVDVPPGIVWESLMFLKHPGNVRFVLFDVLFEVKSGACPFHAKSHGVSLGDLASVVRVGDRYRFRKAIEQLEQSVIKSKDLDEARGQALLFLAVVCAAMLEVGAPKTLHRFQLDAARNLESLGTSEAIANATCSMAIELTKGMMINEDRSTDPLIDRALALVERNFSRRLTDESMAQQLGLSTSHFRFLFKQGTGQPFHKYLHAVRLEKARKLLLEESRTVAEVAQSVGFSSAAHFSRAFMNRFQVSPSAVRLANR